MVHTLSLDNYTPTPRKLVLGTNSSYGIESIKIERGAGWDGLNLTATWHIPGREEPLRVALLDGDAMDVPPEVTKEAKDGVLVLAGLAPGVQRASCNVEYLILEQAGVYGGADAEPTPELAAQVLEAALQAKADAEAAAEDAAAAKSNADKARADAEKAQQAAENAAADAAKAGPYAEAARAAQEAAELARDEAIAAQQAAENAAAAAAASKSEADTLAAEAARAALAAEESKATANAAANLAGENATAAQQAAENAAAAANYAGQSASDAAASKAAAEIAAQAAQEAQAAAAAARDDAVKAQTAAQTAAKSAQDAQAAAEKARDDAKAAQKGAEDARDAAAGSAEAAAKSEENAKQSADTLAESVENVAANTAAVAELKENKAEIDDTAVGANAWSSKHIVDMLCPPLEESGNPVVCYPVAGYPLGVKASWEPMQEGTGTPYPAGGGKNLWGDLIQNTFVSQQGFSSGYSGAKTTGKIPCSEGDDYTLSCATSFAPAPGNIGVLAYFDASDTMLTRVANTYQRAFTLKAPANAAYLRASCYKETDADNVQLEKSATATAYAPYENIRPIKGRDSVKVERCGENLLNIKPFNKVTKNGITYEYIPDGGIHMSGTATANADGPTFPIWHLPPGKYCGLNSGAGVSASVVVQRNARDYWIESNGVFEILAGDVCKYFYLLVTSGTTIDKTVYPYIVSGTTAPTTYTPYIGQTNTLTLPETVYGGEVDAVSGDGSDKYHLIAVNGTEIWHYGDTDLPNANGYIRYSVYNIHAPAAEKYVSQAVVGISSVGKTGDTGPITSGNVVDFRQAQKILIFNVKASEKVYPLENWKAYLAAQYAAGTPVQIAYKLATPTPFTATGAQPLPALAGVNTVLTDADSATVTGRADPIKRITDLEDAVASQT